MERTILENSIACPFGMPIALRQRDLEFYFGMSESTSKRIFRAMEKELDRPDSKLTDKAYIRAGKLVYFHSIAVYWYLQNKDQLEDTTARARVKEFNVRDYKDIF